jgi:uncharacterized protein YdaL
MLKKVSALLFLVAFVFSVSFAQEAGKEGRVEGKVVRSNKDKSTITVRIRDNNAETTVYYDAATKWTSQYHGDKTVNTIEASEVKDGDQVICLGSYKDKEFHASTISKRLSHSPQ